MKDKKNIDLFFDILHTGNVNDLKELISSGLSPNQKAESATLLHVACLYDNRAIIKALIELGANVTAEDLEGEIPLHYLCSQSTASLKILLNAGSEINKANKSGDTPLHYGIRRLSKENIEEMLLSGADPTIKNREGLTPDDCAKNRKRNDINKVFYDHIRKSIKRIL